MAVPSAHDNRLSLPRLYKALLVTNRVRTVADKCLADLSVPLCPCTFYRGTHLFGVSRGLVECLATDPRHGRPHSDQTSLAYSLARDLNNPHLSWYIRSALIITAPMTYVIYYLGVVTELLFRQSGVTVGQESWVSAHRHIINFLIFQEYNFTLITLYY